MSGKARTSGERMVMAALIVAAPLLLVPGQASAQRIECDELMVAYVESSARKLMRAFARDDYQLEPPPMGSILEVPGEVVGAEEPIEFEVVRVDDGSAIVGLIDRRREWQQTYLLAQSAIGPILVSKTWQSRHLRDAGQDCSPVESSVEWPSLTASTVDMKPFDFWGLRVFWRVPSPASAAVSEESVEEVLHQVMGRFAGEQSR